MNLEVMTQKFNDEYETQIESFHWSCFLAVQYHPNKEWGLMEDDWRDQELFLEDLIENVPHDKISEIIMAWEKSPNYKLAISDSEKLNDNILSIRSYLVSMIDKGIYLPQHIKKLVL